MTHFEIIAGHWTEDFLDAVSCSDCKQTFYWSLNANRADLGEANVVSDDRWQRGKLPKYCPLCGTLAHPELRREPGLETSFTFLFEAEIYSIVSAIECGERGIQ